jgi:hypothetical protein
MAKKPDRAYVARRTPDGEWEVAPADVPEGAPPKPLTPTIEAKPQPSPADDPRTGNERRMPGLPGGL